MKATHRRHRRALVAALAATTFLATSVAQTGMAVSHEHHWDHDGWTRTPIKHVVILFSENISFDHYFATYPNAANPAGVPHFYGRPDTPTVNNLENAGLLTNNPNLYNPYRLSRAQAYTCSQDHGYTDEQKAQDGGLMDKFVQAGAHLGSGCRPDGKTVLGYYDGNTVTALWNYAQHYAMSDNSFGTTFGPSTTGAINLVSGQIDNGFHVTSFVNGKIDATEKVSVTGDPDAALDDCGHDAGGTVNGKGTVQMSDTNKNVGDLLNAKGVTWGWFQGGFAPTTPAVINPDGTTQTPAVCGQAHNMHADIPNPTVEDGGNPDPALNDIHGSITDYSSHHEPFMYYKSTSNPHHLRPASVAEIGHDGPANHQYDLSDFYDALNAHNLPAVSYVKAARYQDGHAGYSDPLTEQTFFVNVINALMKSPEWKETAVIIAYDDTDGWYDHVPSPIVNPTAYNAGGDNGEFNSNDSKVPLLPLSTDTVPHNPSGIPTSGVCGSVGKGGVGGTSDSPRCGYGPRMPLLVISPWSKENYVDHSITDQTSTLAFIEYNWNLGTIDGSSNPSPDKASYDRIAGSIMNMFDFKHRPNLRPMLLDDQTGEPYHHH